MPHFTKRTRYEIEHILLPNFRRDMIETLYKEQRDSILNINRLFKFPL